MVLIMNSFNIHFSNATSETWKTADLRKYNFLKNIFELMYLFIY